MKRTIVEKILAAAMTLVFFVLVRTNLDPSYWETGLCAIMLYEINIMIARIVIEALGETDYGSRILAMLDKSLDTVEELIKVEEK